MSQLSTKDEWNNDGQQDSTTSGHRKRPFSAPSTPDIVSKKIRWEKDPIPEYLQLTNEIFKKILTDQLMNDRMVAMTIEDLQQIAVLKHNIATLHMQRELWTVYLKLGTGQWKTYESDRTNVDRRIWPMEVRKRMVLSVDTPDSYQREEDQENAEMIVQRYLEKLNNTRVQHENELDRMKNQFKDDYSDGMEKVIETWIEQHTIQRLRMRLHDEITLLEYNYDAEILEREYLQLQPTEYQVNSTITRIYIH